MNKITRIKLFLSSPTDVIDVRNKAEEVVNEINKNEGINEAFSVYVYRWETGYTTDWGKYQPQINKELNDTDIFVGILWNRFGLPTDNYLSGTEEEFETACNLKNNRHNIELCFYRCNRNDGLNLNNNDNLKQRKRVNEFFNKYNNKIFSSTPYTDIEGFKIQFRTDVLKKIHSLLLEINTSNNNIDGILQSFNTNGITKLYTPEFGDVRNNDKIEFLEKEDGEIYLLAHSGNSYLHTSEDGNPGRFFNSLKKRLLLKPFNVKVILLNPYSLEARKIFYAENFNHYQTDITSIREIKILEQGKNFLRFKNCLRGIEEIKKELGKDRDKIEVRISNVATDGTILMSNSRLFFEPYISSRFLNRIERGLNVFEIQVKNLLNKKQCSSIFNKQFCQTCDDKSACSENLYKTIAEQFQILWATSISLAEFRGQVHKYKDDFTETQPDLFHKQLVQLHDSWYAFDPIIGCSGNCVYCFLGPQGWKNSQPELRKRPDEKAVDFLKNAYKSLNEYKYFETNFYDCGLLGEIPISIGNKTDMLYAKNRENLINILKLHDNSNTKRPLVLITKQLLDIELVELLSKFSFDINIFCSISFLSREFEPNVPHYQQRLEAAKLVKDKINQSNIKNIHLIHYWRPLIGLFDEDVDILVKKIKLIFDCSVCVGLKINFEILDSIKSDAQKLYEYITNKGIEDVGNGIEILEPSFAKLMLIAKKHNYPIFQHTSCALSFVQGKADYNGSMWRDNFCIDCVSEQREKCTSFKENWNTENYKSILNSHVGANYKIWNECIEIIDSSISQEKINYLTHLVGKPVFSQSIRFSLVWPSSNQIYFYNKYVNKKDMFEVIKSEYPALMQQLNRLKGITGFISIIGNDEKVEVFNRYNHVVRVNRLLNWYIKDMDDIDTKKCVFIGLFHDINRLPFAHNLEKHIAFSQTENLPKYMSLFDTKIDDNYFNEFNAFFNKKLDFSIESRIAFLIDAVEGFIEDPLFAFSTLGLDYKGISKELLSIIGFDDIDKLELNIKKLNGLYMYDVASFTKEFDDIVFYYAKGFINKYKKDKFKMFDDDEFWNIRDKIKNQIMINMIFPINNEQVSKGKYLAETIGLPYIEYLKEKCSDPYQILFKQTDNDFIKASIAAGIIKKDDEDKFYPNLII